MGANESLHLTFREARESDLPALIDMLADDTLGAQREDSSRPVNPSYTSAFHGIDADPNNELVVVVADEALVGMLQLTFIPYLSHTGSWRCLIESVRIARPFRGYGLGSRLFQWAIDRARARNCQLVQLTSDKQRPDAIRFYESLGFVASHEGLKLSL